MALVLALLFLVMPIAELAVLIMVADVIGGLNTIGLLVVVSVVGAWLAKRQGVEVLARIRASLAQGMIPDREVADGFLILLAGALMITPGFITDVLALTLLLPPSRALVRATILRYLARRARIAVVTSGVGGGGPQPRSAGVDVWDVESWEEPVPGGRSRPDQLEGPT